MYGFPTDYKLVILVEGSTVIDCLVGHVAIYAHHLEFGLCFPQDLVLVKILNAFNVYLAQLTPLAVKTLLRLFASLCCFSIMDSEAKQLCSLLLDVLDWCHIILLRVKRRSHCYYCRLVLPVLGFRLKLDVVVILINFMCILYYFGRSWVIETIRSNNNLPLHCKSIV